MSVQDGFVHLLAEIRTKAETSYYLWLKIYASHSSHVKTDGAPQSLFSICMISMPCINPLLCLPCGSLT